MFGGSLPLPRYGRPPFFSKGSIPKLSYEIAANRAFAPMPGELTSQLRANDDSMGLLFSVILIISYDESCCHFVILVEFN